MGAGGSAGEGLPGSGLLYPATHLEVFKGRRSELPRAMRDHSRVCLVSGQGSLNGPGGSGISKGF